MQAAPAPSHHKFTVPKIFKKQKRPKLDVSNAKEEFVRFTANGFIEVLLIAVNRNEFKETFALLEPLDGQKKIRSFQHLLNAYHLGRFGRFNAALVWTHGQMGPGILNLVHEAISCLQPRIVLNLGVLFGCKPKDLNKGEQKLGDVVVGTIAVGMNMDDKAADGGIRSRAIRPGISAALNSILHSTADDENFILSFKKTMGAKPRVHIGAIMSTGVLVNDNQFKEQLLKRSDTAGVIAGEMESWTIAKGALDGGCNWLIIKGISDWGDGSKDDLVQPFAAAAAARFAHAVLSNPATINELPIHLPVTTDRKFPLPYLLFLLTLGQSQLLNCWRDFLNRKKERSARIVAIILFTSPEELTGFLMSNGAKSATGISKLIAKGKQLPYRLPSKSGLESIFPRSNCSFWLRIKPCKTKCWRYSLPTFLCRFQWRISLHLTPWCVSLLSLKS